MNRQRKDGPADRRVQARRFRFEPVRIAMAVAVALIMAAGCATTEVAASEEAEQHAACPASAFRGFLVAFAGNESIQRRFTQFPLPMQTLDVNAQPEPKEVLRLVDRRSAKFPLVPGPRQRNAESLQWQIDGADSTAPIALLKKPDTGYLVKYFFARNSCWKLVRIEDWSI